MQEKEKEKKKNEKLESEKSNWRSKIDHLEDDLKHALKVADTKVIKKFEYNIHNFSLYIN